MKCKLHKSEKCAKKVIKTNRIFNRIQCLFTLTSAYLLLSIHNNNDDDFINKLQTKLITKETNSSCSHKYLIKAKGHFGLIFITRAKIGYERRGSEKSFFKSLNMGTERNSQAEFK